MARRQFYRFRTQPIHQFRPAQGSQPSGSRSPKPTIDPLQEMTTPVDDSTAVPEFDLDALEAAPVSPSPFSEEPPQPEEPEPRRKPRSWSWSLIWLGVFLVCGSTAGLAVLWLAILPPPPNCQQISRLAADAERLYCAQEAAAKGEFKQIIAGIQLVAPWGEDHPLYASAQSSLADWSYRLLAIAQAKIEQNDLKGAVAIARQIPPNSPVYAEAEAAIASWEQNWNRGQDIYNKAQAALKAQKWQQAGEYAQALSTLDNDKWRQRAVPLRQQIAVEKLARQKLQQAQQIAQGQTPEQLTQAIALVQKIAPKTYAYAEAKTEVSRWSRALLKLATAKLEQQDITGAIAIAEKVPKDSSLNSEAQDLIQLSRAYEAAAVGKSASKPVHEQLWNLVAALNIVRQIGPERPLYKTAQTQIEQWEKQRQDLVQLQFAHALASMGQIPTLKLAIEQAQMIAPDRPRRIQAQTLIAHWRKEIQRVEDRPYIQQAQQLAKTGNIPNLKAAIAEAGKVAQGRALRIEAQTHIASWKRQIQVLEDKPFLDQARTFAKQGNLGQAIASAEKIRQGRALYAEAQAAIGDWVYQIQIVEDRPILDQASSLASVGSLTQAINVASQIGPSRALYGEAQGAIARWSAERDAILAARAAAERQASPTPAQSPPSEASEETSEPEESPAEESAFEEPLPPEEPAIPEELDN